MDRPAAFFGSYVDAKFMRGLKVMRVSVDVPIEKSGEFIELFGVPDSVSPVPVALARLNPEALTRREENGPDTSVASELAAPPRSEFGPHAEPAKDQDKPRTYTRANLAAIKCDDETFQDWLILHYGITADRISKEPRQIVADRLLKEVCGISSKKELDVPGAAQAAFDKLLATYDYRDQVRR